MNHIKFNHSYKFSVFDYNFGSFLFHNVITVFDPPPPPPLGHCEKYQQIQTWGFPTTAPPFFAPQKLQRSGLRQGLPPQ